MLRKKCINEILFSDHGLSEYFLLSDTRILFTQAEIDELCAIDDPETLELRRPQNWLFNAIMTVVLIAWLVAGSFIEAISLPNQMLFMLGTIIALLVNYPKIKDQSARIGANGGDAVQVVILIFGAGIFMGLFQGDSELGLSMSDAVAQSLITIIPTQLAGFWGLIVCLISAPGTFFISNDGFYFGVMPAIAEAGYAYGFTNLQTFLNLFRTNAGLICVACGITCVMLTGGIDISVGSLVALDCMLLAYGMSVWGLSAPVMILIVLAVGLVFGLVQGICVGYLQIQPFIVTMAGLFFARGMVSVISTEQLAITADVNQTFYDMASFRISLPFGGTVNRAGKVLLPYIGIGVVIALVVLVLVFLMLRYTKFGRSLYAVGGNEQSAAMMGLDVKRTKLKAYVLCSLLCSIGGICYCMNTMMASTTQATGMEMDAISSAVIGGTLLTGGVGNVIGTLFGVLINGTISTIVLTNGKLASSWPNILTAVLLCFFIVLQSIFARLKEKNK